MKTKKTKTITAKEFDKLFDEGGDITPYIDVTRIRKPNTEARRVNVDFPAWMVNSLDKEATRLGVTRQSLIKLWIADKIQNH